MDDLVQLFADATADREHKSWADELRQVFKHVLENIYDCREEPIGKTVGQRMGKLAAEYVSWCQAIGVVAIGKDADPLWPAMFLHLKSKEGAQYHHLAEIAAAISRACYQNECSDLTAFQLSLNVIANIKRETN